ncbi:phospho-sugar mutase [Microbacterium trichothecenolyticum]|uniref:phospho-sugar mutase n=1 Tax=Microbacterium trichothecenolyticum TaxID=69370 RepID=UPI00286B3C7A|nr:phospho-sugar mutase [Microbacterium trichothecenolyticum]
MSTGADAAADVFARAHAWLAQDPDGETRAELRALIEAAESGNPAAVEDLEDRFSARLAFGTAGLRGALGAGSNRMNRVLVAQAAAGLAAYVREQAGLPPVGVEAGSHEDDADAVAAAHDGAPDDGVAVAPVRSGDEPADDAASAEDGGSDVEEPVETDAQAAGDARGEDHDEEAGVDGEEPDAEDGGGDSHDAGAAASVPDQLAGPSAPELTETPSADALEAEGPEVPGILDDAPIVVIGYDGRRNSDVFARDSAEIFAGAGLRAILMPRLLPTPVLAFAVRHFGAAAGVMVTASHNPPDDNGYKVYLGGDDDGSQIVAPADAEIAAHIARVAEAGDISTVPRSLGFELATESVVDEYVAATAAVAPAPAGAEGLTWVYTAMHGVGWETLSRILETAGYPAPVPVAAQLEPDGTFPTVAFPNPEEPGAMDLAFEAAREAGAELVIANDPDADRLAVALPDESAEGGWRRLTGNEIGLLLGWRAGRLATADGAAPASADGTGASLACSLVSSPGLEAVAQHYGLDFHATLTGFKWISRAPGIVFGFEEALGYLVNPGTVRDKDGVSAAVAMLGMVAEARGRGATLADLLTEFDEQFGAFASDQVSIRVEDVSQIARIMAALRERHPSSVGDVAVDRIDDLLDGVDDLPPGDVLRLWLADGSRVIVRPSGTEPKLKLYLDVRGESRDDAAARIAALADGARALLAEYGG